MSPSICSDYYVRSCQLCATLYLTASVHNALVHCSLGVALGEATQLYTVESFLMATPKERPTTIYRPDTQVSNY